MNGQLPAQTNKEGDKWVGWLGLEWTTACSDQHGELTGRQCCGGWGG